VELTPFTNPAVVATVITVAGGLLTTVYNVRHNRRQDREQGALAQLAQLREEADSLRRGYRERAEEVARELAAVKAELGAVKTELLGTERGMAEAKKSCEEITRKYEELKVQHARLTKAQFKLDEKYVKLRVKYDHLVEVFHIRKSDNPLPPLVQELLEDGEEEGDDDDIELQPDEG
jgi:septal ring factor EnvC (AmiA/AmiB activator)